MYRKNYDAKPLTSNLNATCLRYEGTSDIQKDQNPRQRVDTIFNICPSDLEIIRRELLEHNMKIRKQNVLSEVATIKQLRDRTPHRRKRDSPIHGQRSSFLLFPCTVIHAGLRYERSMAATHSLMRKTCSFRSSLRTSDANNAILALGKLRLVRGVYYYLHNKVH